MTDPRQKDFDERHTKLPTVTALTKREYFAAMAMVGILSNNNGIGAIENIANVVSSDAIKIADELIKQLANEKS